MSYRADLDVWLRENMPNLFKIIWYAHPDDARRILNDITRLKIQTTDSIEDGSEQFLKVLKEMYKENCNG